MRSAILASVAFAAAIGLVAVTLVAHGGAAPAPASPETAAARTTWERQGLKLHSGSGEWRYGTTIERTEPAEGRVPTVLGF